MNIAVTSFLRKLGDVADVQIGPFGSLLHKSDYIASGVPVINPMHIAPDGIAADREFSISDHKARSLKRYHLQAGEVIMGRRGEMGRCAMVFPEHAGMICGTGSMKIIPSPKKLLPEYLVHILRTPRARRELENVASGVTMLNLNATALKGLKIPLPPLEEQRRIAGILDAADALHRRRREALALLDTLPDAIFAEMFGENGQTEKVSNFADVKGGKRLPKGHDYVTENDGHKYLRVTDIKGDQVERSSLKNISRTTFDAISRYIVKSGDVVITIAGTIGTTLIVGDELDGVNLTENAAKITQSGSVKYDPSYLCYALRSQRVQAQIKLLTGQVTIGKLALFRIKELEIPIAPLEQQRRFRDELNSVQEIRSRAERAFMELETLFASLQSRAFAGAL